MSKASSVSISAMLRAINSLCRIFNSDFPDRNSTSHVVFRGASMSVCKLIMLSAIGVIWGVFISAVAYWIAVSLT